MENNIYGRIYKLRQDYSELMDYLYNGHFEYDMECDNKECIAQICKKGFDMDFNEVADDFCKIIREMDLDAEKRISEGKRLIESGQEMISRANGLKEYLKDSMIMTDNKKIKTELFTLSVCKNGGKTPIDIDEENVPQDYKQEVVTYKVDSNKIREQLDEGQTLSFARFKERGTHLRIK